MTALLALFLFLLPAAAVLPWRWIPPPTTAFLLQYDGPSPPDHQWVDWEHLPKDLSLAVVASEDQKFPLHHGFDFDAISEVLSEGQSRGASTITQQVAKNLFLWPDRSWLRKGLEAVLTAWIEALWPKRRILEVYLNIAEFGSGVYGAEAASWRFYDHPAALMTRHQAARLAAVLPNPRRMSAWRPSPYVWRRSVEIEGQMAQLGDAWLDRLD